ncbi:MAG: 2,3-bisphosphoglycerate-independent phosphoglycerate mutase [Dehalococcoidia bacterium]|nr:2,3-bisphosphoglycerate-independent phosphoglycerate mutase [Dehalococcoidia bacterium]
MDFPGLADLLLDSPSKILFLVVDGLGGLPHPETRRSELETAHIPHLNALAKQSACGLTTPVLPGITPGSGPGHLALFGYDPLKYTIGRGVLEALGIGLEVRAGDLAARGNFCTVNAQGIILDRRAGRISSEESAHLVHRLAGIRLPGVYLEVHPVKEHRFVVLLRGDGLSEEVCDTDPGRTGVPPREPTALSPQGERTATLVRTFVQEARHLLRHEPKGNMVLLRGWSRLPAFPNFAETYRLRAAAVAAYPMYRGIARVLGMQVLPTGNTFAEEVATVREHWHAYDFFFLHYKPADAAGEDGDFASKVRALEALDAHIPDLLALRPEVLVVAGDHATPALVGGHSWHPVPLLIHSRYTVGEGVEGFNEKACALGSLGRLPATAVMLLVLAHAGRLAKYGA